MKPLISKTRTRRLLFVAGKICWSLRNVLAALLLSIVFCGFLFSLVEPLNLAEGLYLSFITAATIGYGDLAPETAMGRVFAIYAGINGLILTGVTVSIVVKSLELTYSKELEELSESKED